LQIVNYPHPTLRHKSKPLKAVDQELVSMVREMFALMYEHKGVGLAANQVDLPYRLFVMNFHGDPEQPDAELVFINPVISHRKGLAEAEEGCLSIPGVYAQVKRPEKIVCAAYDLTGREIEYDLDGLPARIVQHETDHLDGKLFIDRLSTTGLAAVRESLEELELEFTGRQNREEIPSDEQVIARLAELEARRT